MRTFWLFRSDIKHLEYYHKYKDLESFERNCHDFYLLQGIEFLRKGYFDNVIIWRVSDNPPAPIIFNVNGKQFAQLWVRNLDQTLKYPKPDVSFFRGGFRIYDLVTRKHPKFFGKKLYLGAGKRILPQWGGKYDLFLMEDERDFVEGKPCIPFYKTASPKIFYPKDVSQINWDICWPCNFTQEKYKGQRLFIETISKNSGLQNLRIVHCGNQPKKGKRLCERFGVNNIEFMDHVSRPKLNEILNQSLFGLNLSNLSDGCPRVSTEILMAGTPLIMRDTVRLLEYFKQAGVIEVSADNIAKKILHAIRHVPEYSIPLNKAITKELSFEEVCKKNIELW